MESKRESQPSSHRSPERPVPPLHTRGWWHRTSVPSLADVPWAGAQNSHGRPRTPSAIAASILEVNAATLWLPSHLAQV